MIKVYTDGGSRGNPGHAGCGWTFFNEKNQEISSGHAFIGTKTNNEAEYAAVIFAIREIKTKTVRATIHGAKNRKTIQIFADSKLLVEQITGRWKVKHPNIRTLHGILQNELQNLDWTAFHVRREQNTHADAEANLAMDKKSPNREGEIWSGGDNLFEL